MLAVPSSTLAGVAGVNHRIGLRPVAGRADGQIMADSEGREVAVEIRRIAGDDEARREAVAPAKRCRCRCCWSDC